jgi:osmoprotectant transport system ATP-binding protein
MDTDGARWAIVLDEAGRLHGYLDRASAGAGAAGSAGGAGSAGAAGAGGTAGAGGAAVGAGGDAVAAGGAGDGIVADRARRMAAWVPVGATLKDAFSVMLLHDAGWVAVLDGDHFLGVLTPDSLHASLRRSVGVEPAPSEHAVQMGP